jgi:hypothetical protein
MSFARVRALVIVGILFAGAVVAVTLAMVRDTQTVAQTVVGCPPDHVLADTRLPENKDVKINVMNATSQPGLGEQVAADFRNREFTVVNPPTNDKRRVEGVAVLRYGPKTVGAAQLLRAYFLDEAETEFDIERTDDIVDVVIGQKYRQLGTVTEVNQSIGQLGEPELPKGTCAIEEPN